MKYVSKEDVKKYPLIEFNGNIHVIDNVNDVAKYCNIISKASVVGFDTETKPAFQKGTSYDISLIQLAVEDEVYLFRINKIGFDLQLVNILSNPNLLKVGIDLKNDLSGLKKIHPFQDVNFVDLNQLALQKSFKSIGAVKLSIMLLGFRISKKQRLSDWSSDVLSNQQKEYAAIDAWICPKILKSFRDQGLYP